MADAMYREQILDHYKHPRNQGTLDKPDVHQHELNPLCGDEIDLFLKIENNTITDAKFKSQGCAISTASASMLTDEIKGRTLDQIKNLTKEDVFKMLGVPISPARVKCALLSLKAIKAAAYAYLGEKLNEKIDG